MIEETHLLPLAALFHCPTLLGNESRNVDGGHGGDSARIPSRLFFGRILEMKYNVVFHDAARKQQCEQPEEGE